MTFYNYQWNAEKQKKVAENLLIKYIKKIISKYSPFYREWFKQNGIDPKNIQTIKDFQKIPPITKIEHMKKPQAFILNPKEPFWWESPFDT